MRLPLLKTLCCVFISIGLIACGSIDIKDDKRPILEIQPGIYYQLNKDDNFCRIFHVKSEASCGVSGKLMVMAIYGVPGVQSVYPSPYRFMVTISPIFSWGSVEPEIIGRIVKLISNYDGMNDEIKKEKKGKDI